MKVATLRLELVLLDCISLREKRRRMHKITSKLRRHFNISLAEVDQHDWPAKAVIGVAAVGNSRYEAREILARVADAVGVYPRAELVHHAIYEV
jgi:uncharacterized protein